MDSIMEFDWEWEGCGLHMSEVSQKVTPISAAAVRVSKLEASSGRPLGLGIDMPIQPRPMAETEASPSLRWGNEGAMVFCTGEVGLSFSGGVGRSCCCRTKCSVCA